MEGLNELLKLLADKLGVGLDFVQANAPQYLEEYGRYALINNLAIWLIAGIIITIMYATLAICFELTEYVSKKVTISIGVVLMFSPLLLDIAKYFASPTMYAIHDLLSMLK